MIREIASYGLPCRVPRFPSAPLADEEWGRLLAGVHRARLIGLLAPAVESGDLATTVQQRRQVQSASRMAAILRLRLQHSLQEVVEVLDRMEVGFRLLKGAAVANTTYADPSLRNYVDNDLLIPGAHIEEVISELIRAGYVRNHASPRPGFDARFGKGASMIGPDGLEVDLHRTLLAGPFGLALDPKGLFAQEPELIVVGRRSVPALPSHLRTLHACYHAAATDNPPKLAALRDVAEMLSRHPDGLEQVRRDSRAWRGEAVIARAILMADRALQLAGALPGWDWARDYVPTGFERRALRIYEGHPTYAEKAVAGFYALSSTRDRISYATALIWPVPQYVADRDGSRVSRIRRAIRVSVPSLLPANRPASSDRPR